MIRTSFLPGMAFGEAASVLVGQALGRRSVAQADRTTRAALLLATGFMSACGVVFAIGGGLIARAFTSDEAVAHVARNLLWIAAGFQVLDAANLVLRGALRGAKDVRVPMALGIGIVWTCIPPAALVLGALLDAMEARTVEACLRLHGGAARHGYIPALKRSESGGWFAASFRSGVTPKTSCTVRTIDEW